MTLDYMQSAERTEFEHCLGNGDLKRCDDIVDFVERRINPKDYYPVVPQPRVPDPIEFDTAHWALIDELLKREYNTLMDNNHMMPAEDDEERLRIEQLSQILERIGINGAFAVRKGVAPCL
jgi:hypothetical protein